MGLTRHSCREDAPSGPPALACALQAGARAWWLQIPFPPPHLHRPLLDPHDTQGGSGVLVLPQVPILTGLPPPADPTQQGARVTAHESKASFQTETCFPTETVEKTLFRV